jgi:hypothetical protein
MIAQIPPKNLPFAMFNHLRGIILKIPPSYIWERDRGLDQNSSFFAKTLPYQRAAKNYIYDLHILYGHLWGERFQKPIFERGQIIGW